MLETTAGQGTTIGCRFEELKWLIEALDGEPRIGVCLDTCHIFAAGYDIREATAYADTMNEFDRVIGLDRLRVLHLNDTVKSLGGRVDRHHHIGKGNIGLDGFRFIMNDDRLRDLPKIIETPKGKNDEMDPENLALLRRLARE
jgi:deoxyribonuclease-4